LTSQNHSYAVDLNTLPTGWQPWFINLNDQSAEGLRHTSRPIFSVQFHPEACGGPQDTNWLFEEFFKFIS
jgi:carbamoyl-phosphate synthase small subunit